MRIAIGADHAGFALKQVLCAKLRQDGHDVIDYGTNSSESCDYPEFAAKVGRDVAHGNSDKGILICTTGVGMSIAANKVPGIRAALGTCPEEVSLVRRHNDANILTMGVKYTTEARAKELIDVFLRTAFEGGRHARRLAEISALEQAACGQEIEAKG